MVSSSVWPTRRLGDLCERERGITYGIVKVGEFVADGVPVVRGGDIRDGWIAIDATKCVSRDVSEQFKRTILRGGEVLLNLIAEPGHAAVVPRAFAGYNVSRDVAVIPVTANTDHQFVAYYLRSRTCIDWLRARLQGSVTQKINLSTLREVPVPTPPLAEQRQISSVLATLDEKIDHNRRICEQLERLGSHLVEQAVRANERRSDLRLGEIIEVLETGSRPRGGVKDCLDGVPSIGAEGVIGIGRFDFSKTRFVSRDFFRKMRRGRLVDRDILIYKDGAGIGASTLVGEGFPFSEACINEHVFRLRVRPPYSQELLYFVLRQANVVDELRRRATGAAIPGLNQTAVRDVRIPALHASALDQLRDVVTLIATRILTASTETRQLADLRNELVPRLVTGLIRVRVAATP